MPAREIPRNQWLEFFDSFSRQHEGWLARMEHGGRVLATGLPLTGIGGDGAIVEIMLGEAPNRLTSRIRDAARVLFDETEAGAHKGVTIETAGGETYSLKFLVPAHPELLDGIAGGPTRDPF